MGEGTDGSKVTFGNFEMNLAKAVRWKRRVKLMGERCRGATRELNLLFS